MLWIAVLYTASRGMAEVIHNINHLIFIYKSGQAFATTSSLGFYNKINDVLQTIYFSLAIYLSRSNNNLFPADIFYLKGIVN
jgi:hypothetical protein